VKSAKNAAGKWSFYPFRLDGRPEKTGGSWEFEVYRKDDMVRWVVTHGNLTVFDGMPQRSVKEAQ
jgi:hypothetical protein